MLACCAAYMALMAAAPAAYTRHRPAAQIAMRALRLAAHLANAVLTGDGAGWWQARLLASNAQPARAFAIVMWGLPLTFLMFALVNPCPFVAQPLLAVGTVLVYVCGWLPRLTRIWEHPRFAAAAGAACMSLQDGLLVAEAATAVAFG